MNEKLFNTIRAKIPILFPIFLILRKTKRKNQTKTELKKQK